ncbi:MAG TPA: LacI family DNA-binding transcriptional regulator [Bauldia sp.]|nr:LacI family DNA-binding transcriptional regulator [Bauldia sp.]
MPRRRSEQPAKTASLKDVALRAGVDPSTVSRVLRGDDRKPAKAATRDRVLRIAQEMGYRPNSVARSLRTRRTEAIGLIIPDAANPGFAEIFRGVQSVTDAAGWHVIVVEDRHDHRQELGWDRLVLEGRVDGVLVLTATIRDPIARRVSDSGFPIVLVNRRSNGVPGSVVMNDAKGSEVAVSHFVSLGHRHIAHVAGPSDVDTGRRRLAGFRDAMKKYGIPVREEWIVETNYTEAGGTAAGHALLARTGNDMPTAIYCASFLSGIGLVKVLKEAGYQVPQDISVIVSDELTLAAHTSPPLTTIRMHLSRMGEVGARMLLDRLAGKPVSAVVIPEVPELVVRGSTAPPKKEAPARGRMPARATHQPSK